MKRVFYFVLLVFFLVGVFLIIDKFLLHLIFKPKPGICLILEQKYCKKGKLFYDKDGNINSIEYSLPSSAFLFSPVSGNYSALAVKSSEGKEIKMISIGNQRFELSSGKNLWHQILFEGSFVNGFSGSGVEKKIFKGNIFGKANSKVYLSIKDVLLDKEGKMTYQLNVYETEKFLLN